MHRPGEKAAVMDLVVRQFDIGSIEHAAPLGEGLIHQTWKLQTNSGEYVLQQVNEKVFRSPEAIAFNIESIRQYLAVHHPGYFFVAPVAAKDGRTLVTIEEKYYRLFPFVSGSKSFTCVRNADQAFEAAKQFGRFTRLLSGFDASQLKITIPHFHDLPLRYEQFLNALKNGDPERVLQSGDLIAELKANQHIVQHYQTLTRSGRFRQRVTHHDTKISNVLFNENGEAICVVDLDTVMPGYFISDLGDMMRTYLSEATEEENDFSKIVVRQDVLRSVIDGYFSEMSGELTAEEASAALFAGEYMIYMQALRFFTDFLNKDVYYGSRYENHNYLRAGNQMVLLQRYREQLNFHDLQ